MKARALQRFQLCNRKGGCEAWWIRKGTAVGSFHTSSRKKLASWLERPPSPARMRVSNYRADEQANSRHGRCGSDINKATSYDRVLRAGVLAYLTALPRHGGALSHQFCMRAKPIVPSRRLPRERWHFSAGFGSGGGVSTIGGLTN
jgi:hypothetical protein